MAANLASVTATVLDDRGREVGRTETSVGYSIGLAHTLIKGMAPGRHSVVVSAEYAVSDPDTIDSDSVNGRVIFLQVAQLRWR